jgi:sRNA-binding carbon storage regulator CsrA
MIAGGLNGRLPPDCLWPNLHNKFLPRRSAFTVLILTRRCHESIIIDGKIRLAIEAPPNVTVDREEVHLAKEAQRKANKELKEAIGRSEQA